MHFPTLNSRSIQIDQCFSVVVVWALRHFFYWTNTVSWTHLKYGYLTKWIGLDGHIVAIMYDLVALHHLLFYRYSFADSQQTCNSDSFRLQTYLRVICVFSLFKIFFFFASSITWRQQGLRWPFVLEGCAEM